MKISELINLLEDLKDKKGDIKVKQFVPIQDSKGAVTGWQYEDIAGWDHVVNHRIDKFQYDKPNEAKYLPPFIELTT